MSTKDDAQPGQAARAKAAITEGQAPFTGYCGARLMPLAFANLKEKLDATAYSVSTGGLSQTQMDEFMPDLGIGALLLAFAALALIVVTVVLLAT
ncbi:MAG: hypothetical protein U1E48_07240 [Paracoccaceae bacterium]